MVTLGRKLIEATHSTDIVRMKAIASGKWNESKLLGSRIGALKNPIKRQQWYGATCYV